MGKKKMLMRKFGSVAVVNNTFIGGVASVINTPALLAAKLEYYPSGATFSENDIQNFTINGSDIECYIGVDYTVRLFGVGLGLPVVTYYRDYSTKLKNIGTQAFYGSNLIEGYFPSAINISTAAFDSNVTGSVNKLKFLYIPNVLTIGNTVGNDNVFRSGNLNNGNIYANPSLQTVNAGGVEGDLAYLETGNTVTYVTNFNKPNPVTDLTVNAVYATVIKLDWSIPSSTNAIDYYEVYIDGVFYENISTNEITILGLTNLQTYNFSVIAVDIFYNKSEMSNVVTQQINGVDPVFSDPSSIISYYKFENNVLDSIGNNDGIATDITYASGKVGNAAVFNGSSSRVLSNSSDFDISGNTPFSISTVFKLDTLPTIGKTYGIVAIQELLNQNTVDKAIRITSDGRVIFYGYDGSVRNATSNPLEIAIGNYYVVIGVYDGSNLKLYVNGVLKATLAASGTFNFTNPALVFSHIGSNELLTDGNIDDSAIYNRGLSQTEVTEITNLHNAGFPLI